MKNIRLIPPELLIYIKIYSSHRSVRIFQNLNVYIYNVMPEISFYIIKSFTPRNFHNSTNCENKFTTAICSRKFQKFVIRNNRIRYYSEGSKIAFCNLRCWDYDHAISMDYLFDIESTYFTFYLRLLPQKTLLVNIDKNDNYNISIKENPQNSSGYYHSNPYFMKLSEVRPKLFLRLYEELQRIIRNKFIKEKLKKDYVLFTFDLDKF